MYNIGIIGLGNIGFKYDLDDKRKGVAGEGTKTHVSAYNNCKNVDLCGVVDIDNNIATQFKTLYPNIPVYKSVTRLMKNHNLDFVSICTPTSSHYNVLKEVIKYPIKGILCEKPIAHNLQKAQKMIELCDVNQILLSINHGRRWHNTYLHVKKLLDDNSIGNIKAASAIYSGEIFNIGTHLFDTIRMLINKDALRVSGIFDLNSNDNDPSISGWIEFDGGIFCAILTNSSRFDMIFEIDLIGTKGRIKIVNNGKNISLYHYENSKIYSGFRELKETDPQEIKDNDVLVDAVKDNILFFEKKKKNLRCTGHDGYKALELSISLVDSAKLNGEPIKINNEQ